MVFARRTRSESGSESTATEAKPRNAQGWIVDPFSGEANLPDPSELAEKVVFQLWSEGAVKGRAIEQARREAGDKMRIDQALTRLRLADPEEVAAVMANLVGAPLATDKDYPDRPVSIETLPPRFLRESLTLPLSDDGQTLVLAMSDPLDDYALRAIAMKTRRRLAVKVACANRLEVELDRLYPVSVRRTQKALPAPGAEFAPTRAIEAKPQRTAQSAGRPGRDERPELRRDERQYDRRDARHEEREEEQPAEQSPKAARGWTTPSFLRRRKAEKPPAEQPESRSSRGRSAGREARREVSEQSVEDTARELAFDLETDQTDAAHSGADAEARPAALRPKFVRPKRVTLKDKTGQSRVSRGEVEGRRKRAKRRAPPADHPSLSASSDTAPIDASPVQETAYHGAAEGAEAERGAIAAQVRAQVAARRAERERLAAEGRGPAPLSDGYDDAPSATSPSSPPRPRRSAPSPSPRPSPSAKPRQTVEPVRGLSESDLLASDDLAIPTPGELEERDAPTRRANSDPDAPLRFGEIRSHAVAAKAKASPARRRVLDRMRAAISGRSSEESRKEHAPAPAQTSAPEETVRYQAAAAMQERDGGAREPAAAAPIPKVDRLKKFRSVRTSEGASSEARGRAETEARFAEDRTGDQSGLGVPGLAVDASARPALDDAKTAREGLILLAGPSGSGKIETVRKLAEFRAGGKVEIQRFDQPGAQFPRDVSFRVYWGEIRDAESAEAAARAAMTGALVIATLDSKSAAASPSRLVALGLPPYALASSLRSVLSQNMDEASCSRCAETGRAANGGDCIECDGEGRLERVRIGESMLLDDTLRALILSGAPEEAIRHAIQSAGRRSASASSRSVSGASRGTKSADRDVRL